MECAGAHVEVIEKCSGHDGAWSAKTEFFELSMNIAEKAVRAIDSSRPIWWRPIVHWQDYS